MLETYKQQPLIQLSNVNKYYPFGGQSLHILKNISLEIFSGEFVTIMGPSGSGKSTLINILGFLDNKFEGQYVFESESVANRNDRQISLLRNKKVGFVFQDFNLISSMNVGDNVRLPLLYSGLRTGKTKSRVYEALKSVGLESKISNRPHELSGGQKQRVAIARSLINNPSFVIADEPTGALDSKTSIVILDILARLNRQKGVTIIMVTHDPSLEKYATRKIKIVDGEIVFNNKVDSEYQLPDSPLIFDEVMLNETN